MKARMHHNPALLRKEFLKRWIKGLHLYRNSTKNMTISERKRAIKLSADIAMASTRTATTRWSRALIADVSRDASNRTMIERVSGPTELEILRCKASMGWIACSRKILKRSRVAHQRARGGAVTAGSIAKKLMLEKKTRMLKLKRLVPGGEGMDEVSLIRETIDYIVSLRVQVDVMGRMADRLMSL